MTFLFLFLLHFFKKTSIFVYYNVANQIVPLLVIVFVAGYWYRLQLFAEVPIPSACVQLVFWQSSLNARNWMGWWVERERGLSQPPGSVPHSFTPSLPLQLLIALARTFSMMLNSSDKAGHSCLDSHLKRKAFIISPLNMMQWWVFHEYSSWVFSCCFVLFIYFFLSSLYGTLITEDHWMLEVETTRSL